jgi:hypothetical protein
MRCEEWTTTNSIVFGLTWPGVVPINTITCIYSVLKLICYSDIDQIKYQYKRFMFSCYCQSNEHTIVYLYVFLRFVVSANSWYFDSFIELFPLSHVVDAYK